MTNKSNNFKFKIPIQIKSKNPQETKTIEAVVDSAATISVINEDILNTIYRKDYKKLEKTAIVNLVDFGEITLKLVEISLKLIGDIEYKVREVGVLKMKNKFILGTDLFQDFQIMLFIPNKAYGVSPASDEINADENRNEKNEMNDLSNEGIDNFIEELLLLKTKNKQIKEFSKLKKIEIVIDNQTNSQGYYLTQYPLSQTLVTAGHLLVDELLESGTILEVKYDPNIPLFINPVIIVRQNEKFRFCVDFRMLNSKTIIKNGWLPNLNTIIEEILQLEGNYFTIIDLHKAFHQLLLEENSRKYTQFVWKDKNGKFKNYQFMGCPFGLKNLPTIFQNLIHEIFIDLPCVFNFIDDIILISKDKIEHEKLIKLVIERLNSVNLKINWQKSKFFQKKIEILGQIISKEGLSINRKKIDKIKNLKPHNSKELRTWLGIVNYLRRYIPHYSFLTSEMEKVKNNKRFEWSEIMEEKFQRIIEILDNEIILSKPDFNEKFYLITDSSFYGISGMIFQIIKDQFYLIEFAGHILSKFQINYSISKKELFSVVFHMQEFKQYLYGRHFTVLVDNMSVMYLLKLNIQKEPNDYLLKWLDVLGNFDFDIFFISSEDNFFCDKISRLWNTSKKKISKNDDENCENYNLFLMESQEFDKLSFDDKIMFFHKNSGHFSESYVANMMKLFGFNYYEVYNRAKVLIKDCVNCKSNNFGQKMHKLPRAMVAPYPNYQWDVDLLQLPVSRRGFKYILVVIDVYSRFSFLKKLKNKTAKTIAGKLIKLFLNYGIPQYLKSDNGLEIKNVLMEEIEEELNIVKILSPPYCSYSNGLVENNNKIVTAIIKKTLFELVYDNKNWEIVLDLVGFHMNNRISSFTKFSPFSLYMFKNAFNNKTILEFSSEGGGNDKKNIPVVTDDKNFNKIFPVVTAVVTDNRNISVVTDDKKKFKINKPPNLVNESKNDTFVTDNKNKNNKINNLNINLKK